MSCKKTKIEKDKTKDIIWFEGESYSFNQRGKLGWKLNKESVRFSNSNTDALVEGKNGPYVIDIGLDLRREGCFNYKGWIDDE